MQSKAPTITAYLAELNDGDREVIAELDELVRQALPNATASMKYGMPTYDFKGRTIALNAQKNYFSFYADPELVAKYRAELKGLSTGKSCIRFTSGQGAPMAVLRKILSGYGK